MTELTAEMIVDFAVPQELDISPDGTRVAYALSPNSKKEEHASSSLWVATTDGSRAARQFTRGDVEDHKPKWSPDGSQIAFLSDRDKRGTAQLYLIARCGSSGFPRSWSYIHVSRTQSVNARTSWMCSNVCVDGMIAGYDHKKSALCFTCHRRLVSRKCTVPVPVRTTYAPTYPCWSIQRCRGCSGARRMPCWRPAGAWSARRPPGPAHVEPRPGGDLRRPARRPRRRRTGLLCASIRG